MTNATHIFTNQIDQNDEPHFLYAFRVEILERFGMTYAGFDCLIRVHAEPAIVAGRLGCSVEQLHDYSNDCTGRDDDAIVFECNYEDDLREIQAVVQAANRFKSPDEACPGCDCMPGDGITESCNHPDGCGYWKSFTNNRSVR